MIRFLRRQTDRLARRFPRLASMLSTHRSRIQQWFWLAVAAGLWALVAAWPTPPQLGTQGQLAVALVVGAAVLFATEAIPLPAIGLSIPVYQVVVGGMETEMVTDWMMSNALLFLMGTLMLVAALASRGLDKMIALFILTRIGTSVRAVVFAIVTVSALLAGFMSDAAAALMLAPVLGMIAVLQKSTNHSIDNLTKLLLFSVAFGTIAGSPYTPAGGARNVIMLDYVRQLANIQITFSQWMLFMSPYTVAMVGVLTVILPWLFPPEQADLADSVEALRREVGERPFGLEQMVVLIVFATTIVLWLAVGDLFGIGIIAIGAASLLLIIGVVDWHDYQRNVDWGVLMIYIGAISLGGYTAETGAAFWIADEFLETVRRLGLGGDSPLVVLVAMLTTGLTSTMSAGATTSVLGPIVLEIAAQTGIPAVVMGLATALASSFGFMLLVSTPGNAIVYSSGYVSAFDFIRAGFWVLLCAFAVFLALVFLYWPLLL